MSENKHNPTPWSVKTSKQHMRPKIYEIKDANGMHIADVNIGMSGVEENASLIVESVNTRDSLKARVEELQEKIDGYVSANLFYKLQEAEAENQKLREAVKIFQGHKVGYVASGFRHLMKDEELDLIESLLKK